MTIRDRKELKQTAARRLTAASYNPKKLILIHSGVILGVSLLLALLDYFIVWQINTNGSGLAGLGMRSVLETVQMVLNLACAIATPFWSMGVIYAFLRLSRNKAAWPGALLEGFSRKGPVLRLVLMQGLIYGVILIGGIYGSYLLFSMTPNGYEFTEVIMERYLEGVLYTDVFTALPDAMLEQATRTFMPICCVVLLVLLVPAAYRMRLAPYVLMDQYGTGAWKAIRTSGKLTRRNCGKLLLLDLSYWWYYLVQLALTAVSMLPVLLTLLEVELPVEETVLYVGCNVAYTLLMLSFETQAKPKLQTVYALAYDALREQYDQANPPMAQPETAYSYGNEE